MSTTGFRWSNPLIRFQRFWADWSSLNTIDNVVSLEAQESLRLVLSLTVAKVDSIGFVVRK